MCKVKSWQDSSFPRLLLVLTSWRYGKGHIFFHPLSYFIKQSCLCTFLRTPSLSLAKRETNMGGGWRGCKGSWFSLDSVLGPPKLPPQWVRDHVVILQWPLPVPVTDGPSTCRFLGPNALRRIVWNYIQDLSTMWFCWTTNTKHCSASERDKSHCQ